MSDTPAIGCRIGFIGAGKMASALAAGMLKAGIVRSDQLSATDVFAQAAIAFENLTGARMWDSPSDVMQNSDVIFLAVKPQHLAPLLNGMQSDVTDDLLLVSIAAGVSLSTLEAGLNDVGRIIRVMPNTPCLVSAGACAYSLGTKATADDADLLEKLLSTVGIVRPVDESLLDTVTGLSGSGPAYVYQFIEALSDGGVRMGLPRQIATELAAQTVLGAAKMVLETGGTSRSFERCGHFTRRYDHCRLTRSGEWSISGESS